MMLSIYACLLCSVGLVYISGWVARGAPVLTCGPLRERIYPHDAELNSVGQGQYFIDISSFRRESTYIYSPRSMHKVMLQSKNTSFNGFLVQATLFNGSIVGKFHLNDMVQYSSCSSSQGSISHNVNFNRNYSSVTFIWQAPTKAGVGPVIFRFTVSQASPPMVYSGRLSEVIHESTSPYILVANQRYIRKIDVNGDHRDTLVSGDDSHLYTIGVGYHLRKNLMIRVDQSSTPSLVCSWLETTFFPAISRTVAIRDMLSPSSVAVDWINDKLYWTDEGTFRIEVAELSGAHRSVLIAAVIKRPRGLVVDPMNGWMYWVDWKRGVIERASMDGTARSILHSSNIIYPVSLALDRDTQKLYWIDSVLNRMESSFVDGSNRKILITSSSTLRRTHGMAVFQNLVYWTEQNRRKLHRISTSSPSGFISTLWTFPTTDKLYEITVVAPSDQPAATKPNPCGDNNGGCNQLCLLSSTVSSGYKCACATGLQLAADGRNCLLAEETVASFFIMGARVSNCLYWTSTGTFEKLFYISYAMAEGVNSMCNCGFTSANIMTSTGQLECQETDNRILVQLSYHSQLNTHNITVFVTRWIKAMHTITVLGTQFTVSSNETQMSISTQVWIIIGAAFGATCVVVCCIFIVAVCIVFCIAKKRKGRPMTDGYAIDLNTQTRPGNDCHVYDTPNVYDYPDSKKDLDFNDRCFSACDMKKFPKKAL